MRGLYCKFLLFAFYVAVIVFSTDDEQLLKETGAHLPLLGVDLPLLGFYIFIPWLVLIFHAHLLCQFYLLSRKLFDLDHELGSLPSESARIQRGLIFPLIFSHRIVGTQHPPLIRRVFGVAVVVTILLVPVVLLLGIQWMFLPYHGEWITFNHQLVLTLDFLLLWFFWPRLSSHSGHWRIWWPRSKHWRVFGVHPGCRRQCWYMRGILGTTFLLFFGIWGLLVPPGNGIKRLIGYQPWPDRMRRVLVLCERTLMRKNPPVELLSAARKEGPEEKVKIWLEDGEALDLHDQDLRYADFSESRLWDADLQEAQLQGVDLREAVVYGTKF